MLWDLKIFGSGTGGYTFYVGLRSNLTYSLVIVKIAVFYGT